MSIGYFTSNKKFSFVTDWPRPESLKTSEDDVKKSFLFEPQASLKDFSRRALVFRAMRMQPRPFLIPFLCHDKKRNRSHRVKAPL
jgi:hypothetical protein